VKSAHPLPLFENIVQEFEQKIYKLCWYLLKNHQDAQDCTQDIFVAIYQALPNYRSEAQLSTWIYRISMNKCYEYVRKSRRKKRFGFHVPIDSYFSQTLPSSGNDPEETQIAAEKSIYFWKCVDKLPIQQQLAYTLFNIEEFSYREIAAALSTTVSAVESLLFRARRQLAKDLEKYRYE
jgi:RNA polymerase sigma-70 factor (ECF subfamily)